LASRARVILWALASERPVVQFACSPI
jgi:hypothetical protein